jgi:ribosomal protein L9
MLGGVSFGKIGTQETYVKTSFQRQFIAKRQKAKTAAKEKMSEENVKAALT